MTQIVCQFLWSKYLWKECLKVQIFDVRCTCFFQVDQMKVWQAVAHLRYRLELARATVSQNSPNSLRCHVKYGLAGISFNVQRNQQTRTTIITKSASHACSIGETKDHSKRGRFLSDFFQFSSSEIGNRTSSLKIEGGVLKKCAAGYPYTSGAVWLQCQLIQLVIVIFIFRKLENVKNWTKNGHVRDIPKTRSFVL